MFNHASGVASVTNAMTGSTPSPYVPLPFGVAQDLEPVERPPGEGGKPCETLRTLRLISFYHFA